MKTMKLLKDDGSFEEILFYTLKESAEILSCDYATVAKLAQLGFVKFSYIGRIRCMDIRYLQEVQRLILKGMKLEMAFTEAKDCRNYEEIIKNKEIQ